MASAETIARPQAWTVASLLLAANDALVARFGACAVRGEVSGFSRAASGHCYFTLKDGAGSTATLRCAMFRRAASLLDFAPRDGLQVEVRGRIAVYEARGELQLVVESMQRVGAGTLYEEFLRLKAKLEREGLFDAGRKRELPSMPRRVGVVTSLAAAALRDVLTTLARRAPHVAVVVYPSPVQGAEAPAALVEALELAARRNEVDVLILCRGGGALEDLWAFNDEGVVRAAATSPIPLVCGVGHETDVTLADLAADLRAPTPTAAAELASPAQEDLLDELEALQHRMRRAVARVVEGHAVRLDQLGLRLMRPGQGLGRQAAQLQHLGHRHRASLLGAVDRHARLQQRLADRCQTAAARGLQQAGARLDLLESRLKALDPRQVLTRGYAWVTDPQGRPIVSAVGLDVGQQVRAVWADGEALAEVTDVRAGDT
jgi:exodeoxyribonuclease VII large subunit